MNRKTILQLASSIGLLVIYLLSANFVLAKADSLIINNDGSIDLVMDTPPVLGESTVEKKVPLLARVVPIVPANRPTTVTVTPAGDDKKVKVTIREQPKNQPPAATKAPVNQPSAQKAQQNPVTPGGAGTAPTVSTTQPVGNLISTNQVDRVVVQGQNNNVILSVSPSTGNQLLLQQETVKASTSLPIAIDSTTHTLSASTPQGNVKLLMPKLVVDSITQEGLLKSTPGQPQAAASPAQLSLTQTKAGEVIYSLQRQEKLFGSIPLPPATITVSNTTGKVSAPILLRLFSPFLR